MKKNWHRHLRKNLTILATLWLIIPYQNCSSPTSSLGSSELQSSVPASHTLQSLNVQDLDGVNGFTVRNYLHASAFGKYVAGAGDFNGDGFADIMIAAPLTDAASTPSAGEGEVYILLGRAQTAILHNSDLRNLSGINGGFKLSGTLAVGSYGANLIGGDFNGDGSSDLAIGAYTATPSLVDIFFGRTTSGVPTLSARLTSAGPANLGYDLSSGDFNGDGLDDLVVSQIGSNQVYIVLGRNNFSSLNPLSAAVSSTLAINFTNNVAQTSIGRVVKFAGDVDGDGFDDLLVTSDDIATNDGRVYLIFGRATVSLAAIDNLNIGTSLGANGIVYTGLSGESLGMTATTGLGDINNDGFADFALTGGLADPSGRTDAGQVYVVFGGSRASLSAIDIHNLDGINGFQLNGGATVNINTLEASIRANAIGDINNDGFADFAIGEPSIGTGDGRVYVFYGHRGSFSSLNGVNVSTATDEHNGFTIHGLGPGEASSRLGTSISPFGDFNGDNYDDFIIGAPVESSVHTTTQYEGAAHVILGGPSP